MSLGTTRIGLLVALVVNAGLTIYGHFDTWFYFEGIASVAEVKWGFLVLTDFAFALLLLGVWVFALEGVNIRSALWAVAVLIGGTPLALIFFLLRSRKVATTRELFLGESSTLRPAR